MSQFSNQLQKCIEDRSLTQTGICDKTGLPQGTLSRYVNGENRPPLEALERLFGAFPQEDQVAMLLAYLLDDVPTAYRKLVRIAAASESSRVAEDAPDYRARMPRKLREAFDFLGNDALKRNSTAEWIIANHERLRD